MTPTIQAFDRIAQIEQQLQRFQTTVSTGAAAAQGQASTAYATSGGASLLGGAGFAQVLSGLNASSATGTLDLASALAGVSGTDLGTTSGTRGVATGAALVEQAKQYLGVPYAWGGEDSSGIDCSGLVLKAMQGLGVDMPRVARDQMREGQAVPSLDQALPGDLVVFGGGRHIGIYVGDGQMIDAPRPGKVVQIRDVYETPTAIRRVLPPEAETATTGASSFAALGAQPVSATQDAAQLQRLALSMLSGGTA